MRDSTLIENGASAEVKTSGLCRRRKPEGTGRSIVFEQDFDVF